MILFQIAPIDLTLHSCPARLSNVSSFHHMLHVYVRADSRVIENTMHINIVLGAICTKLLQPFT
jgi:hypothetical protein